MRAITVEDCVWEDRPPVCKAPFYPFYRPKPGAALRGWIVCNQLTGIKTHYIESRTTNCTGEGRCEYCAEGIGTRWHGYVALTAEGRYPVCIATLTTMAVESCRELQDPSLDLRGLYLVLTRQCGHKRGRIAAEVYQKHGAPQLPKAFNLREVVARLYSGETKAQTGTDRQDRPKILRVPEVGEVKEYGGAAI